MRCCKSDQPLRGTQYYPRELASRSDVSLYDPAKASSTARTETSLWIRFTVSAVDSIFPLDEFFDSKEFSLSGRGYERLYSIAVPPPSVKKSCRGKKWLEPLLSTGLKTRLTIGALCGTLVEETDRFRGVPTYGAEKKNKFRNENGGYDARGSLYGLDRPGGHRVKIHLPPPRRTSAYWFCFCALAGVLLGAKLGGLSVLLYVALGLAGLPVFYPGGGPAYVLTPSFGYLIGFLFAAVLIGFVRERCEKLTGGLKIRHLLFGCIGGLLIVYLCGVGHMFSHQKFLPARRSLPLGGRSGGYAHLCGAGFPVVSLCGRGGRPPAQIKRSLAPRTAQRRQSHPLSPCFFR